MRSINLRIGFVAALLAIILAFNWVSPRKAPVIWEAEEFPSEVTIKPFTILEKELADLPTSKVLKPNDVLLEVPDLQLTLQTSVIPVDTTSNIEPSFSGTAIFPKTPIAPPPPPDETEGKDEPWLIIAEEMPRFPGCEDRDLSKAERTSCANALLLKHMYENIRYPELARHAGFEGTVYIKFVVERDGSISNAQIVRDIGGGCGEEALKVVNNMPKWLPGKQRGRPVRVQFNLPVKFKLS